MNNAKKSLVPHRRFKEFQNAGAWEQRKLGEVVEITMGQSPSSKNYTENPNDHILVQGNADMKNGYVVPRVWTTQITKQAEKGDLILSVRAPVGDIGKTDYDVVLGRGVAAIKGNSFIFQLLTKMKINGYWTRFSTGSTFESINSDNIKNAQISIPSLREQEKIGGLFNEFDSLIALHQRKLNKLKKLKSAYLTEMFPDEGEHKPKRRFAGFTDDWEQRKFMDLIDSIIDFRGRTPKKLGMNWSNEGLLALSAQNVKDGYIDKTIDAHYGSQTLYDKWMNGRELHKGQVVFTTEAPMGNVARIPDENKYILSQRTIAFTVKNTVLTEGFLMYLLESPSVKNNLLRISSGGTAKGVSQKTLSSLTVKIPTSLKEQERINFVFYSLDSLITLHQRKIDKLQKLKNAYLNEMFV